LRLYVINLDRSSDRLAHATKVFTDLGLEFTRIPAVDGNEIDEAEYQWLTRDHTWPIPLTRPEVGCFLSHRKFLQIVVDQDEPYAAIFEDDVKLSPNIKPLLTDHDWIKAGTDIVKLDVGYNIKCWGRDLHKTAIYPYRSGCLISSNYSTAGYIISRSAAKCFLALTEYVHLPIDVVYFDPDYGLLKKFNIQQLIPAPVIQTDLFVSTIINTAASPPATFDKGVSIKIPRAKRTLLYTLKREIRRFYCRYVSPLKCLFQDSSWNYAWNRWIRRHYWGKIPFG